MNKLTALFHNMAASLLKRVGSDGPSVDGRGLSVLVTSSARGEGKTTVALALARYVARISNRKVLLVDANLENPQLHSHFAIPNERGLSDSLLSRNSIDVGHACVDLPNLAVVPGGRQQVQLKQEAIAGFNSASMARYDLVIYDGSTLGSSSARFFLDCADFLVLVVDSSATRREIVKSAVDALALDSGRLLGVVLNKKIHYIPSYLYERL